MNRLLCRLLDHVPWVESLLPNGMWAVLPDEWTAARLATRLVCRRCGASMESAR